MPVPDTANPRHGRAGALQAGWIGAPDAGKEFGAGTMAALPGPVASALAGGLGTGLVVAPWARLFPAGARHGHLSRADAGPTQ